MTSIAADPEMPRNYSFTQLGVSDRDMFIQAWERSFVRVLSQQTYGWIFNGKNRLYAAFDSNEIAAGYCLYPLEAMVAGKPGRAALCNNVFADPKHQGKFLFSRLGRFALQAAAAEGISLAYGLPNRSALPGHRRVGWKWQTVPFLARKRDRPTTRKQDALHWSQVTPSAAELAKIEDCSRRSASGRNFSIIKTAEFASWRFVQRPLAEYWFATIKSHQDVCAYAVAKYFAERRCLHILDIDGAVAAVEKLIAAIDTIDAPFDCANLWSSTAHRGSFERAGFSLSDESNTLILIDPTTLKGLAIESGLNLALADNDVY
ncbi:MAG: GNAT family N-acetyltransferase [Caldimonas sp.]